MLKEISIENLAVIERADARFTGQFNVFTGETGAGKSILIGGINAILGHRTTKDIVRTGAPKAVISALFDELPQEASDKLAEFGFASEDGEVVLTREISADGKSTARINGRTATAAMLREIGGLLVDIHGQHENRILMSNDNQRDILDSYGEISEQMEDYRRKFRAFAKAARRLKELQQQNETRELKIEHLTSVVDELEALDIGKGDGDRLEQELERCRNFERIRSSLYNAYNALSSEDSPAAVDMVRDARDIMLELSDGDPRAEELAVRLEELLPELEDISSEIFSLFDSDNDESVEEALADRVSAIRHAKRKYNMDSDQLVDYLEDCRGELLELDSMEGEIEALTEEKHSLGQELKAQADKITGLRTAAAEKLSKEICDELSFLDMPQVRIEIAIKPDKVTIHGRDSVEMLISANVGEELKPLNKIASGGELSRIMLAIKSVLADSDNVPTLIFDEVDAGISGRAAQKVGIKLAQTARKRQVLCITHLAQIASRADCHLLIEKHTEDGRTFTRIENLDFEGRKLELARIIDGDGSSENSLKTAEEMLLSNEM